jgi:hypothetical protein
MKNIKTVSFLVESKGLEPSTPCLQGRCSRQIELRPRMCLFSNSTIMILQLHEVLKSTTFISTNYLAQVAQQLQITDAFTFVRMVRIELTNFCFLDSCIYLFGYIRIVLLFNQNCLKHR